MIGSMARVRRVLGCIAGAAMVGVLAALLVQSLGYTLDVTLSVALSLAVGLGVAVGIEAAEARLAGVATERPAAAWWVRWVEVGELILLGVAGGALEMGLAHVQGTDGVVNAVVALAAFGYGVAAALMVIGWRVGGALRAAPFCVVLGMLYGLSVTAGTVLANALLARPCPPYARCLEFDWRHGLLSYTLFTALPVGLCLGIILWAVLSLGRLVSMGRRQVYA